MFKSRSRHAVDGNTDPGNALGLIAYKDFDQTHRPLHERRGRIIKAGAAVVGGLALTGLIARGLTSHSNDEQYAPGTEQALEQVVEKPMHALGTAAIQLAEKPGSGVTSRSVGKGLVEITGSKDTPAGPQTITAVIKSVDGRLTSDGVVFADTTLTQGSGKTATTNEVGFFAPGGASWVNELSSQGLTQPIDGGIENGWGAFSNMNSQPQDGNPGAHTDTVGAYATDLAANPWDAGKSAIGTAQEIVRIDYPNSLPPSTIK